jgi:hypothetical protein
MLTGQSDLTKQARFWSLHGMSRDALTFKSPYGESYNEN